MNLQKITPFLWFDGCAERAARFYVATFGNGAVTDVTPIEDVRPGEQAKAVVSFELFGQRYLALDGGPDFQFTPAVSFMVDCADQAEIDDLWTKLTADGGEPAPCGWLRDRFGLSWQIVPSVLPDLMDPSDPERAARVRAALYEMEKIEIAGLQAAFDGARAGGERR